MEVLFKDDKRIFHIKDNTLNWDFISRFSDICDFISWFSDIDLTNIPHLDDAKVLYHYRDIESGKRHPVYYEHNDMIITQLGTTYALFHVKDFYAKDNTLVNLNLL